MPPANFDRIARIYRWLEYLSFGPMLERCRFYRIPQLTPENFPGRRILVLGDGDGRFLAHLLARNPRLQADAVDQSPAMLRLLQSRVASVGGANRVRTHLTDARAFQPAPQADSGATYDAVITHFFLDCLTIDEVHSLARNLRPQLAPNALWIVSEFAIPRGPAALLARAIVGSLYAAFHVITGLRTRTLPDYADALSQAGFALHHRQRFLAGLLVSDLWREESE
ncbi:MAG TPA: class I SAM-dependent methyltransferase [Silvibacterium sp.]|nr:class I SAM-dependent methyltransferase [Silvibacterium sp.]